MKKYLIILIALVGFGINSYASPIDDISCSIKKYASTHCVRVVNKGNRPIQVTLRVTNGGEWYTVSVTVGTGERNIEDYCNGHIQKFEIISAKYIN
ncbi:hypothetical protein [Dysgonomonas sp. 511]|uniref:hypothetical protein n=1 Tax=Dysgonomonas sp. 511 TaxID=2302930 RepID=UPI0013D538E2|nr:hypothetical protein [Dysgonomonas sp. 511]NDV77559.1 hypothetical protein [Dysgonomonas sp. 511]